MTAKNAAGIRDVWWFLGTKKPVGSLTLKHPPDHREPSRTSSPAPTTPTDFPHRSWQLAGQHDLSTARAVEFMLFNLLARKPPLVLPAKNRQGEPLPAPQVACKNKIKNES
ncbi:hypothetical protein HC62_03160 [Acetobacter tropicalis]|uniref:Uncharacterized protein n=2 Tax=Acetobacter tropicalis TaxID=104102 RepID=A0A252AAU6_9PROT|nr:hypothetical protein HC62_03160 [Acetobacter tropicalis]